MKKNEKKEVFGNGSKKKQKDKYVKSSSVLGLAFE